ncbi:MAG: class I SAM-dependent methyltransferase [Desulfobacula sp.]|nr:class I SAM-dependent methyltransferase [Desulfobacula sp.]
MRVYDKYILPKLIHWVCSHNDITSQRKKLIPHARGKVLEIGIGSGLNLPFYKAGNIDCLWGIEPLKQLQKIAEQNASDTPFNINFIGRSGEDIPLENSSADTIVVTYTLCTILDIHKALKEMHRVLKPNGNLIFCEHGKAPAKNIAKWQNRLNPAWKRIAGGCNLNRDIPNLIKNCGFKIKHLDMMYMGNLKLISFNYQGFAVKRH